VITTFLASLIFAGAIACSIVPPMGN
jgi:hypothetical protein